MESCHDSIDGMRRIFSDGPEVVTSTFCRYSSTTASISVELSESLLLWISSCDVGDCIASTSWFDGFSGPVGVIVNVDVSCSSSTMMVLRGDVGSPNKSHSLSISSFFFLVRGFGFGIDTIDGLLKQRKIRRETSPAVDKFAFDWMNDALTDCRNEVAAGFNWL